MQYKTMTLGLIQERPRLHDRLRARRALLPALDEYARRLKSSHEAWQDRLRRETPGGNPSQIASAALEFALRDLEDCLDSASPWNQGEPPPDGGAIGLGGGRTPPP